MNSFIRTIITGFAVFFALGVVAQPTIGLSDITVASGGSKTMKVTVKDFTDINKYQCSINWNPAELEFVSVQNLDAIFDFQLSLANFDLSDVVNGNLVFLWEDASGDMTIEDNNMLVEIFQIEFKALIPEGSVADVIYSDLPQPIIFNRTSAGVTNIYDPRAEFTKNGTVTTTAAIPDVFFNFINNTDIFCKGDQICYDLELEDFDSILGMQFAIIWQGSVLEFDHAENFGLEGLDVNTFKVKENMVDGEIQMDSIARALWQPESRDGLTNGVSIADGASLLTICFNVVGEPNSETLLEFTGQGSTPLEVFNKDGIILNVVANNPLVKVTDCENLVFYATQCMDGAPNDTICVDFTASNFKKIVSAKNHVTWDPTILEFIRTENYGLPNLTEAVNFNVSAGSLLFEWEAGNNNIGTTLQDGATLYSACFVIKGAIDTTSFINFLNLASSNTAKGENDTPKEIKLSNCEVKVLPPKVIVSAEEITALPNETLCIGINMENFLNVKHIEMPIEWDPTVLEFFEIQSIELPGLTMANFDFDEVDKGILKLVGWDSPSSDGVSFDEATDLFYVCLTVIGSIGDVSPITFPNTPDNPVFIENNNQELDVIIENGSVIIESSSLVITSEVLNVEQAKGFCVDIRVSNFQEVSSLEYIHAWDPSVLRFDSVSSFQLEGLTQADLVLTSDSTLKVIWLSGDFSEGTSVENGSVIYSLCFNPIGDLKDCANFSLSAPQEVTTVKSEGNDIGIFDILGDICIDNFGVANAFVSPPSCDGGDGILRFDIEGDEERYVYLIQKNGLGFAEGNTTDSIRLENLSEGEYCVFIFAPSANKNITECFTIEVLDSGTPIPVAGEDIDVGCVDLSDLEVQLDGSQSLVPQGGIFSYNWTVLGEGQIRAFEEDKEKPIVTAIGTYILTVINSTNKCSAADTIVVFNTAAPSVQIEPVNVLGCTRNTIELLGDGSEIRENNIYFWTTDIGNFVSDSTTLKPIIDQEGLYTLTVMDTINGCTVSKNVSVFSDKVEPKAAAGQDRQLGCEDDFITLSGEGSSVGQGVAYEWSTPDGSSIVNSDKLDADVSRVGTYILLVTNEINGCQSKDTMLVLADESLPVARASNMAFIGCNMDEVILDGSASSQGVSFAYQWKDANNQSISTEDNITTSDAGEYLLIVTNIDNDDCISDTVIVEVQVDKTLPASSITQGLVLSCSSDCLPLSANIPDGDHYLYQWITEEGLVCEDENAPTAMVGAIGLYKFIVVDTLNNCADTSSVIVAADASAIIADAGPARQIGCNSESIILDGRGSSINDNITFSWTNEAGDIVSTESIAEVTEPGQYTLTIEDSAEGCKAFGKVSVTMDTDAPLADAGDDLAIPGCEFPESLNLSGSNSDSGLGITFEWAASDGGQLSGDITIVNPKITGPGTFILTVTNGNNGCSSSDTVIVGSDMIIPIANAGPDKELSCAESTIGITGINEVLVSDATIEWTTADGNIIGASDELDLQLDAAGTYLLKISSPDGCSSTDEVIITANLDMPTADAGEPLTITCNKNTFINASGTTGDNIEITWTSANGNIISGGDTYSPEVNLGGTYLLTVTNIDNSCAISSNVVITADDALPLALAGDNQEICGNETTLTATPLGDNINGIWTTLEKSMIVSSNDPATSVADLEEGRNTYIWTLSTEDCPNYSADTLIVNVPILPVANDDVFEIQPGQSFSSLNLIANDQINSEAFDVNITTQPITGQLSETSIGVFEFTAPARYYGSQQFQYEICSATCFDLCDNASVRVIVLPGADVDTTNTIPNAITPNGDGLNDMFQIDELIFDATEFPQSELVIFNRWGDVVFQASPYNNDWSGKTNAGDDLPEGTYYFVLRLDIAEGEVMKGDITVLR